MSGGYPQDVAKRKVISAAELDAMSPDERAQVVRGGIVHDLDDVPSEFREKVRHTAARLAAKRATTGE